MPAFDWPAADPPVYAYPMDESNAAHNDAQDQVGLVAIRTRSLFWGTPPASCKCRAAKANSCPVLRPGRTHATRNRRRSTRSVC